MMFELMPIEYRATNLDRFFDRFEREMFGNMNTMVSAIRTDIVEEENRFLVKAELPGFDREDIQVSVDEGRLTISAARQENKEDGEKNYIRRERRYGAYRRSFDISGIDAQGIEASYKDGILELCLPKTVPVEIPVRNVEIH